MGAGIIFNQVVGQSSCGGLRDADAAVDVLNDLVAAESGLAA